jgi:putative PIN family toxin of toxin-antitoxin system
MRRRRRIVVDSNALIRRLLLPASVPGRAVREAVDEGVLLVSEATLDELATVLARPKFDPYVPPEDRRRFLVQLARIAEFVPVLRRIEACRDPGDDKFLEVAINGDAELIVTGDQDLLALHPFMEIPIVNPADHLET